MKKLTSALAFLLFPCVLFAQVEINNPWVRATVPAQKSTGAFLELRSANDARLVEAASPVAETVELHNMVMEGDVMKMRRVPSIDLPAGINVALKPGSHHIMLMDLKTQIRETEQVPLFLIIEDNDGRRETLEVTATAHPLASNPAENK